MSEKKVIKKGGRIGIKIYAKDFIGGEHLYDAIRNNPFEVECAFEALKWNDEHQCFYIECSIGREDDE